MSLINSNNAKVPQPIGLVPLYPFPPLTDENQSPLSRNPLQPGNSGFSFLPPIYPHNGKSSDDYLNTIGAEILKEVITEEILDFFEESLLHGIDALPRAQKEKEYEQDRLENRISKSLAAGIIEDVLIELCRDNIMDYIDDTISDHRNEVEARLMTDYILRGFEMEFLQDIANDVLETCECGEISMEFLHEVLFDESKVVVEEVLIEYGAKVAFLQYKDIMTFASDHVLDGMCQRALLSPTLDASMSVVDHIMLDVLLNKSIELKINSREETCIPLQWYRKKMLWNIILDMTLNNFDTEFDKIFNINKTLD